MTFSSFGKVKVLGAFAMLAMLAACGGGNNTGAATGLGAQAQPDRIYFPFNANGLTDDAKATLGRQAAWLARYPQVQIQIAGNCDDRGTEEYNLALGNRRANAARDYLVAQGVSADRITTISYGKDRPTALGDD